MPIPDPYQSFAEICLEQGLGYEQWQKTAETGKIVNLLYDQIIGRSGIATRVNRGQALINYLAVKALMTVPIYADASAEIRLQTNELTYTNTLINQGADQFGLCGRFHRVLTSVLNELEYTGEPLTQAVITQLWIDRLVGGLYAGLSLIIPPTVAPITAYSIDGGDLVINDGSTINGTDGVTAIVLVSSGVGEDTQQWELDTVPLGGETGNTLVLDPAVIADSGTYRNGYTNGAGTTYSAEFDVVVAA